MDPIHVHRGFDDKCACLFVKARATLASYRPASVLARVKRHLAMQAGFDTGPAADDVQNTLRQPSPF
jgi:hypothetical protein